MINQFKTIVIILNYLNELYPVRPEKRIVTNQMFLPQDKFISYKNGNKWIIACIDYWLFTSKEFKEMQNSLQQIFIEENMDVEFNNTFYVTVSMIKKSNKDIFIGRTKVSFLS